jgi:endonuclease/exonuclease/phosphatase family metal-dependent hydrolase
VRLATWNIRHGEMQGLPPLAAELGAVEPDLVALQEVDRGCLRSGLGDQARWLGESLGLAWAFAPAMAFDGGEYGVALLARPALVCGEALASRSIPLPGGLGPGEEPRALLLCEVAGLRLGVVHLDLLAPTRLSQAEHLVRLLVDGAPRAAAPLLLAGDFNERPDQPAVQRLMAAGLRDAWREAGACERPTAPVDRPGGRIDLLLMGPGAPRARLAGARDGPASDHPLLWFDLA